jgi:aminopeptidase N
VVDRAGHALRTSRHGDTLVVFPTAPAAFGDTLVFTVTYHGKIKNGSGLTFITTDGMAHRPRQIWSQGEDHDNHYWFPTYDFPNDKMTWELSATVDGGDMAVSNGRLVSDVKQGASHTLTWNQDRPSATYLVSLVVAPLAKIHDAWEGIPVDYYTYHADSANAWRLFHETPDLIGVYSQLTGVKYPWAKYAQTTVADFFGGMENVSATTLVDWLPDARAYADRPWYSYILIPHELAHQWFGDYVTTNNWANMWLNEGFAEFMPGQYWGTRQGAHAEQDYYVDEYRQYLGIEGDRSMPLASSGSNNIYPKGALVLEMLKHYLGEQRFWASIHTYLTTHALSGATSDDLRQAVLATTGENLDWFWSEWVYQAGYPQFSVTATYDTAGGQHALVLDIKQTQADSLKADSTGLKYTVPPAFRMPATIRVGTANGDVVQRVWLDGRAQKVSIPVSSAPTMVIFDDGNAVLKRLDFDEPTAWLVTQLTRDQDLWNRAWIIEALGRRPADAAAGQALANAAQHADYYLTRVQAAEALDTFPAAVAGPALTAALKDTSAAVRGAAIRALSRVGGAGVAATARPLFASDPSYDVRAAALAALIRADPAGAHAVIAQGLSTPSYRDAIQSAALRAIFGVNDTTFIPSIDSLVAVQQLPVHLLAALGAKGNTHALDLLAGHLNDPRRTVRQWTLQAYRFTLAGQDKALAVTQLKARVDGIRFDDTKKAADDLLKELQK